MKTVVIVGGGSAGWITAGVIAARHKSAEPGGVRVVLIESPNMPIIGVGEGTWPTMRSTLSKMGISETEFIRECDATFKQGAKFRQWASGGPHDFYYHPLMLPTGFQRLNPAPHWERHAQGQSFSNTICPQEAICELGLAPKAITTPEYEGVANYAYHLNAGKFASFLRRHCTEVLGVTHILDDVTGVAAHDNGDIRALNTANSGELAGDLFVDCTGFASLLLGQHYGVPFIDRGGVLFIDRALAVQLPYAQDDAPIASQTISTAQRAGWIWDIGLTGRRGIGHVYSSRHTSADEAMADLAAYVGPAIEGLTVREIPIRSGHRAEFWRNNCVAVGLSAGFLEPLEASALMLVELSAAMIAEQLPPDRAVMDIVAKRFNATFRYRWDRIIDFLKLHYCISTRDEPFWRDNRDPATIPDSLQELLALWRHRAPGDHDFTSNNEVFPAASYQYVLYGMGFASAADDSPRVRADMALAARVFAENRELARKLSARLPRHRDLIDKVRAHGLQRM